MNIISCFHLNTSAIFKQVFTDEVWMMNSAGVSWFSTLLVKPAPLEAVILH